MHASEKDLKEFLLDSNLVSKKEIDAALAEAAERTQPLGDILVSRGLLTDDALRHTSAYVLGIPFVNLIDHHVPIEVFALIPEPVSRTHNVIAFKKDGNSLEVAVLDIKDLASIDSIRAKTGLKILARLTDTESIKHALLRYQKLLKDEFGDIISTEAGKIRSAAKEPSGDELKRTAEELPTVRIVDTLLRHAVVQGASDVHIEPTDRDLLIRYRIDGVLHDAMTLPKAVAASLVARIKILAHLTVDEHRVAQDGRFLMETESDRVSFRVSTLPTSHGERVVMRVLRETGEGFTLEALGFHGKGLEQLHKALTRTSGLILVAGPEDSGKTTTLYTLLDILNTPRKNLSTIEDSVEYRMKRINHVQANAASGFVTADALRALLRQDPDVVMIGEIRDEETASLALQAALSGHLVLAAITADSALGAITKLSAMNVDLEALGSALQIVVGQRLVRRLAEPKQEYRLTRTEREKIGSEIAFNEALAALREEKIVKQDLALDAVTFYKPTDPEKGYKGRIGIQEVLAVSSAIKEMVVRANSLSQIETQAKKEGMLTLLEDGIYKAARGITTLEEARNSIVH